MIFVTTYARPQLLLRLLQELQGEDVVVLDDSSDYDHSEHEKYCGYYRFDEHCGKQQFWHIWQTMFNMARSLTDDNEFIFLQDDLYNVDLEGLRSVQTPDKYALNLMDVGPDRGWSPVGYCDCIFRTNRATLEQIGWSIDPVPQTRWKFRPTLSSGVGQRLSQAFYKNQIPMILPNQNYASHGDNESQMHPNLREVEPLIAKTTSK